MPALRNAAGIACCWPADAAYITRRERRAVSARRMLRNVPICARNSEALRTVDRKTKCERRSKDRKAILQSHCLIAGTTPTQSRPAKELAGAINKEFESPGNASFHSFKNT